MPPEGHAPAGDRARRPRNISVEFARTFKQRASANSTRLARLVADALPELDDDGSSHFAGAVVVIVAGLWPYANPTPAIAAVMEEMGSTPAESVFADGLRDGLVTHLIGVVARGRDGGNRRPGSRRASAAR